MSAPAEQEYVVTSKQEPYIHRKALEGLLKKVFQKDITVYVRFSKIHGTASRLTGEILAP